MGICESTNKEPKRERDLSNKNQGKEENKNREPSNSVVGRQSVKDGSNLKYSRYISDQKDIQVNANQMMTLSTGTPVDNYIVDQRLGEGSYGVVFRVKHKDLGVYRAMKKIFTYGPRDPEKEKEIMNEIEMLKNLDHPNIVKVFEFYNTDDGYYIITEYCKGGELFDRIIKEAPYDETKAAYLMYQLLSSVFYCHNLNIIHRDLKPENMLVESEEKGSGLLNIKVIDFGTAKIFEHNKSEKKVIGSAYYIAPEVLNHRYNEKCDIWSCGVIMYILLSARPPFSGSGESEDTEIMEKILKGKFDLKSDPWHKVSSDAKDLIRHMMDFNPNTRYSAQKCLTHKWFKNLKIRDKFTFVAHDKMKNAVNNCKKYRAENKLQQAALAFLAHNSLHLPEVKDLLRTFRSIDENGDGRITKEELNIAFSKIYNVPDAQEEVDEVFANIDNDNNGFIEYEEYIRASIDKNILLNDNFLRYTFKYFDKDGSGEITVDEIISSLIQKESKEVTEDLAKELLASCDMDSNQSLDYEEFKAMMWKLLK